MTPKVTFVIPSYNHAPYVAKAIESVLSQDYPNIDLLVIDDGSTDKSDEIIQKLSGTFGFQFIKQKNQGLIAVLNRALELATGEYFCWGGSDDYFHPSRVSYHVRAFESDPSAAVSYGKVRYINATGERLHESRDIYNCSGLVFDQLIKRCFIPAPASMIKTQILREVGGFDNRFFLEDYPLWLKIAKKYPFVYIDKALTYYRLHDSNVSSNTVGMVQEVNRILSDWQQDPAYKSAIGQWHFRWFCDLCKQDEFRVAEPFLKQAIAHGFYYPKLWKYAFLYLIENFKFK